MSHSSNTSGSEPAEGRIQAAVARRVDGVVIWIARHWLALFNSLVALYLLLPFLAPVLANAGLTTPASLLYSTYSATCHQLPERSYFLFGERPFYSLSALEASGLEEGQGFFQRRAFRGNDVHRLQDRGLSTGRGNLRFGRIGRPALRPAAWPNPCPQPEGLSALPDPDGSRRPQSALWPAREQLVAAHRDSRALRRRLGLACLPLS